MNPYATARQAYTESAVMTASPGQLVVMLYDGAIRFLRQSAEAMRAGDREQSRSAHAPRRASHRRAQLLARHELRRGAAEPADDLPLLASASWCARTSTATRIASTRVGRHAHRPARVVGDDRPERAEAPERGMSCDWSSAATSRRREEERSSPAATGTSSLGLQAERDARGARALPRHGRPAEAAARARLAPLARDRTGPRDELARVGAQLAALRRGRRAVLAYGAERGRRGSDARLASRQELSDRAAMTCSASRIEAGEPMDGRTLRKERRRRMGLFDITDLALQQRPWQAPALRQQVLANNLANANTPGFKRSDVDFESTLASALVLRPTRTSAVGSVDFQPQTDTDQRRCAPTATTSTSTTRCRA